VPENLVTYRDLGTKIGDPITYPQYAQLDYILVPQGWQESVLNCRSAREAALASHHYLLYAVLNIIVPVQLKKGKQA
jgi:hypothetical protein